MVASSTTLSANANKVVDLKSKIQAERDRLSELITPENGATIDRAGVIQSAKDLLGLLESHIQSQVQKQPKPVMLTGEVSGVEQVGQSQETVVTDKAPSVEPVKPVDSDKTVVEPSHCVIITIPDSEIQSSEEAKDSVIPEPQAPTQSEALQEKEQEKDQEKSGAELRPFVKYDWEMKRLAEQWIFSLQDIARLTHDDWNVLTLSPATTLSLYCAAAGLEKKSVEATPEVPASQTSVDQVHDDGVKRLKIRVLDPILFEKLTICVNVDFAPTSIELAIGFPQQYTYALMFKETVLCHSRGNTFSLKKEDMTMTLEGELLLRAANWDLRNFENGGLWIDCPGSNICKMADNGRFFFSEYTLKFMTKGITRERFYKMHTFCTFDFGHYETVSMEFSHPTDLLHWDNPANISGGRGLKNYSLHGVRQATENALNNISLPNLGKVWVHAKGFIDMLPEDYKCIQVYME